MEAPHGRKEMRGWCYIVMLGFNFSQVHFDYNMDADFPGSSPEVHTVEV